MKKLLLTDHDLANLGYPKARATGITLHTMHRHYKHAERSAVLLLLADVLANPQNYLQHPQLQPIAVELCAQKQQPTPIALLPQHIDFSVFGRSHIDDAAYAQMQIAMRLPVSRAGSLMPDAHSGYGLPIGGVLATSGAVIPYGVGVDIGCRMCLTLYDVPVAYLKGHVAQYQQMLLEHTRFGIDAHFEKPIDHEIFDHAAFAELPLLRQLKDRAYRQIGTSGSGNHFVEFGEVSLLDAENEWNLPINKPYLAVLSHSGSRGFGATIAQTYTQIAMQQCLLPNDAKRLAWLDLDSEAGQEYWLAMNLAGDYAAACHHQIHRRLARAMGEKPIAMIENHHNFAWKEAAADGTELIVHRKGATPAAKGVLGIIPGSMATEGFLVRGKGNEVSLNSASHGAGRLLSRTKAKQASTQKQLRQQLQKAGVTLLGGGLDESPHAYKDIHQVMKSQTNLVEVVGTFMPRIVRMANDSRSED